MHLENDFLLHKTADRRSYYYSQPPVRYSQITRKWFVFSTELIERILRDPHFQVPSYDRQILADRFGIPNEYTKEINDTLPLSVEGNEHQKRRERVALQIASKSKIAKMKFADCFDQQLKKILYLGDNSEFCLVKDLFLEPIREMLFALSDLTFERNPSTDLESIPQMFFDDAISLKKRETQEAVLSETFFSIANPYDKSKKLEALGLIIVSINTLLGTIVGSVFSELSKSPRIPLYRIEWPSELSFTSLPYIERVCKRKTNLGSEQIKEGDVVRLFLDVATFAQPQTTQTTELIFAIGIHRCLGIGLSKSIWQLAKERLAKEKITWTPLSASYRQSDNVFNFFETVRVLQNV